jgi:hypothetical protein
MHALSEADENPPGRWMFRRCPSRSGPSSGTWDYDMVEKAARTSGDQDIFLGTFSPFFRAFERPIAMACLRLLTFPPRPPLPVLALPFLYRRISLSTERPALREYFRRFLAIGRPIPMVIKA